MKDFDKNMPIKSYRFYNKFTDKTKANWLAYEVANELYDVIDQFFKDKDYGIPINPFYIEEFSVFIAKGYVKMLRSISQGEEPETIYAETPATKNFNGLDKKTHRELQKTINKCFNEFLLNCRSCPTRCVYDFDGICYMFDKGPY